MLVQIFTPKQVERIGLKILGVSSRQQEKQQKKTNLEDFRSHYGTDPVVIAQIWEDLQTVDISEARIDTTKTSGVHMKNFLRTHHFLMRYETENERKVRIKNTQKTVRKWQWYFLEKMKALRAIKIVWPDDNEWKTHFIASLDGVNCRFHEVIHPTLAKNPKQKDHKSGGPGLSYELALHLWKPQLVWLKGPENSGENNDLGRYQAAFKEKIPEGKKVITDRGYNDKKDPKLCQPNSHDVEELRTFKARARMRQEAFHSRIMKYNCLTNQFRHSMERHSDLFTSICIICVYEMELVSPMWEV